MWNRDGRGILLGPAIKGKVLDTTKGPKASKTCLRGLKPQCAVALTNRQVIRFVHQHQHANVLWKKWPLGCVGARRHHRRVSVTPTLGTPIILSRSCFWSQPQRVAGAAQRDSKLDLLRCRVFVLSMIAWHSTPMAWKYCTFDLSSTQKTVDVSVLTSNCL